MASYTGQVATIHRQFNAALKRAKSRQAVLNAYWKHKAQHEKLLKQHLIRRNGSSRPNKIQDQI